MKQKKIKINKFLVVLSLIVLILTILFITLQFSSNNTNVVTAQELSEYATEYRNEYHHLCSIEASSLSGIPNQSNFTFFDFKQYTAYGVISNKHGTALLFDKTGERTDFKTVSGSIEYVIWNTMTQNTKGLPIVEIADAVVPYYCYVL